MSDLLSQDEIDALLNAVQEGEVSIETETDALSDQTVVQLEEKIERTKEKTISKYDFRRPEIISKDQIRTLQMIHKTFCRSLTNALSSFLRTTIEVNLMAVDQLTYGEFNMSLGNPTCINTFTMEPMEGLAVLEINPIIVFAMIERLLGGGGRSMSEPRALTDIELAIFERALAMSLNALRGAWVHVEKFELNLKDREANPQFIQVVAPGETVILITLEIKMAEASGIMSICYPFILLEPIVPKLSAQQWISASKKGDREKFLSLIRESISGTHMDVVAELGTTQLRVRDLINLKKGDAITLNRKNKDPIQINIKGVEKFLGMPGIAGRYKVVKLKKQIKKMW